SLFDEVFLVGSPSQPEIRHLDLIAQGQPVTSGDLEAGEDLPSHIRASLRLKAADFERLWHEVIGTPLADSGATTVPSLDDLTRMYRTATLAAALRLSVVDLFDLATL